MQQRLPSFQEFKTRALHSFISRTPFHLPTFTAPVHRDVHLGKNYGKEDGVIMSTSIMNPVKPKATSSASPISNKTMQRTAPRRGPPMSGAPCLTPHCKNLGVSIGLCKAHGGGKRCGITGCKKSSQSRGLCRAHGGGKICSVGECTRGAQRGGLCYMVRNEKMYFIKRFEY